MGCFSLRLVGSQNRVCTSIKRYIRINFYEQNETVSKDQDWNVVRLLSGIRYILQSDHQVSLLTEFTLCLCVRESVTKE